MKNAGNVFLVMMLFTTLGLWGWAQQKNGNYASRLRELEARCAKMEDDHRGIIASNDRNQKRVVVLEHERKELVAEVVELRYAAAERDELRDQLTIRVRERDDLDRKVVAQSKSLGDLRSQLAARTLERDQVARNMQLFSRELQSMLGRMENSLNETPSSGSLEATPASRRAD